jgi:chromatin remodeling complex protein RSC6
MSADTTEMDCTSDETKESTTTTTTTTTTAVQQEEEEEVVEWTPPKPRIPEIWAHFMAQMDQIDELEKRLNEHATRSRRRIASVLDQFSPHRRSHLRMFVTHNNKKQQYDLHHSNNKWTLVIEGKLLVGLLDHKSAARVEQEGALSTGREQPKRTSSSNSNNNSSDDNTKKEPPPTPTTNSATTTTPTSASKAAADQDAATSASRDRSQYRTVGDKEEEPVEPILFTHFFEKLTVVFQTVYQPKSPPSAASSLHTPKKSRKRKSTEPKDTSGNSKTNNNSTQNPVHPKHLRTSKATTLEWTKKDSQDANAFLVHYDDNESDIPADMKFHSVVATITMHSMRSSEALYKPSSALADAFFPKHKNYDTTGGRRDNTKRNPPLDNDIQAPSLLTMNEITMALFQYIQDKRLHDPSDKSLIVCDKTLTGLLECESLNFSQLHQTLLSKNLVLPVGPEEEPTVLTYVMTEKTTSPQEPPGTEQSSGSLASTAAAEADDDHTHQVLSFDMDVSFPGLFHYRARDVLRRIKRREFEYTSSRTKARYLLVASRGNEDIVKNKIEQAVSGQAFSVENIPVFLALAKAAPPNSEARNASQIDAKTCALVERLDECSRSAEAAWDLVEACQGLGRKN